MAVVDRITSKVAADVIKNENVIAANTATRVGGWMGDVAESAAFPAVIPVTLSANQNNWSPTDFAKVKDGSLRVTTNDATKRIITGFAAQVNGFRFRLLNRGSGAVELVHQSGSSSSANQIYLGAFGTSVLLAAVDGHIDLEYDTTMAKWCVVSSGTGPVESATPAQLTANQNDYAPTGLGTVDRIRVSADAARTITGLVAQADGYMVWLDNVGVFPITLAYESASSAAANRFNTDGTLSLQSAASALLVYDGTLTRWRVMSLRHVFAATIPVAINALGDSGTDGRPARSDHAHPFPDTVPAKGTENYQRSFYPSTQVRATVNTAGNVTHDVAIPTGVRLRITAEVWVDDGAGGAVLFTKALETLAHQTGGAAVKVLESTVYDNSGAGFTFTSAVSTTNIRYTLANTSGTNRPYNIVINYERWDKP